MRLFTRLYKSAHYVWHNHKRASPLTTNTSSSSHHPDIIVTMCRLNGSIHMHIYTTLYTAIIMIEHRLCYNYTPPQRTISHSSLFVDADRERTRTFQHHSRDAPNINSHYRTARTAMREHKHTYTHANLLPPTTRPTSRPMRTMQMVFAPHNRLPEQ